MTSRNLDHTNIQRLIVAALGTLFFAVVLTGCNSRHAACSAYGEIEPIEAEAAQQ